MNVSSFTKVSVHRYDTFISVRICQVKFHNRRSSSFQKSTDVSPHETAFNSFIIIILINVLLRFESSFASATNLVLMSRTAATVQCLEFFFNQVSQRDFIVTFQLHTRTWKPCPSSSSSSSSCSRCNTEHRVQYNITHKNHKYNKKDLNISNVKQELRGVTRDEGSYVMLREVET